jgi:4,5-dihydroxyphthalate decarboxylase
VIDDEELKGGGAPANLHALLGDYPGTRALKDGTLRSPQVTFDFAPVEVPNRAFKQVVRELSFDVAELAIATFLQAKALGSPLVLLPATVLGRHQHSRLAYNPVRGPLAASGLGGRRVGIRSCSVTTAMWIRGILARDHGVDLDRVRWVTFEDAHVAEYRDPPGVERAPAGKDLVTMLHDGELDAGVLGAPPPAGSPLRALIPDPDPAARDWCRRNGAVPVNHLVVVSGSLARSDPGIVREVYRLLAESRRWGASSGEDGLDLLPFGTDALRPSLALAIDYAQEQGLLVRRLTVDELFDDTTRAL